MVHPIPNGHIPEENPEESLQGRIEQLVDDAELHLLRIVGLRLLEFFLVEKLLNVALATRLPVLC